MKVNIYKSKNKITYFLAKTLRTGKTTTTQNIEKIGTHSELLKKHPDPLAYCKELAKERTKQEKEYLKEKFTVVLDNSELIAKSKIPNKRSKNIGYFYLKYIYEKLNIKNFLRRLTKDSKIEYDPNNTFEYLVYSRILDPHSKTQSLEDFKNYYGYEKTNYQDIFKTMDIFPKYLELF